MSNTLLPCPFCGGSKNVQLETDFRPERTKCNWSARVICLDCFGAVQTRGFEWTREAAKNEAIAAWNRRTLPENELLVRCGECIVPIADCPCGDVVMLKTDFCSYGKRKPERSEERHEAD